MLGSCWSLDNPDMVEMPPEEKRRKDESNHQQADRDFFGGSPFAPQNDAFNIYGCGLIHLFCREIVSCLAGPDSPPVIIEATAKPKASHTEL